MYLFAIAGSSAVLLSLLSIMYFFKTAALTTFAAFIALAPLVVGNQTCRTPCPGPYIISSVCKQGLAYPKEKVNLNVYSSDENTIVFKNAYNEDFQSQWTATFDKKNHKFTMSCLLGTMGIYAFRVDFEGQPGQYNYEATFDDKNGISCDHTYPVGLIPRGVVGLYLRRS